MKLSVSREPFINFFLKPLANIGEIVSIKTDGECLYSIVGDGGGYTMVTFTLDENSSVPAGLNINVANVKSLMMLFNGLTDEIVKFYVKSNHLHYKSPNLKFKYYLLDDCVVPLCSVKKEKIDTLSFNFKTTIAKKKISELLSGTGFTSSSRMSFYTKDGKVWALLGDTNIANKNEPELILSESFEGEEIRNPIVFNIERLKGMGGIKYEELEMRASTKTFVTVFDILNEDKGKITLILPQSAK